MAAPKKEEWFVVTFAIMKIETAVHDDDLSHEYWTNEGLYSMHTRVTIEEEVPEKQDNDAADEAIFEKETMNKLAPPL